ncbi:MAG: GNAT family N-acetyltransferase [Clostridium sp.]|uniref:GNAT family N-acetyltransferase n=1 Tax=Clostridium sp. TaxID=1506 RepID=UPI0030266D5C
MRELSDKEMKCLIPLINGKLDVGLWACIEGKMMGRAWVDNKSNPSIAMVLIADFCYLLGCNEYEDYEVCIKELIYKFKGKILVSYNNYWDSFIERHFVNNYKKYRRYAIKREVDVFERDELKNFIDIIECEFSIEKIDETNYNKVLQDVFMADCCSNFSSLEEFLSNGIGYIIIHKKQIISGASSYVYCKDNIDITIGTKKEYRKKGLALACAAKVILDCLDKNIYPKWDAANLESVALAERLGYHFDKEYYVYSIY